MGDRTTVYLTVLKAHADQIEKVFNNRERSENGMFVEYTFYGVNYGELDDLPELAAQGIAYTSRWDSGSEYGAGEENCRFTSEGEMIIQTVSDESRNPSLNALIEVIDDYALLKTKIIEHANCVVSLPWDNQEEYGKRYRTSQLIQQK